MATSTATDAVLHERRKAGLWLTLNRPERFNGLSPEILDGLRAGLDTVESDPDLRAVVVTSAGRAFCAGADLRHMQRLQAEQGTVIPMLHEVAELFDRIERSPVPVIAAVPGLAAGGGLELLLCCDLVVLAQSATIADAHANYGLLPGGGATVRLARLIGHQRAKQLMFTGEFVTAAQAYAFGIGNEVADDDQLVARTEALVDSIAAKSPLGLARMKQLIDDGLTTPIAVGVRAELTAVALHEGSHDQREGVAAFNEKRVPRFEGR
jgi:enoyl-CoA hydratase